MPNHKRTKIICTLGPASDRQEVIEGMLRAGMNVARLNFSHGTHEQHAKTLTTLRAAAKAVGRPVGVLQDLCGPKVRVGQMPGGAVELKTGQVVEFFVPSAQGAMGPEGLPVDYEHLAKDVRRGNRILFDDGALEAQVEAVETGMVRVRMLRGGKLKSKKGMNLPGIKVSAESVTKKDLDDLEWGIANGVDWVALSFVREADDLIPVKRRLEGEENPPMLIAKIETPEGVENAPSILAVVDGIMVARGDLGVELPFEQVPTMQKRLIRAANIADKPVITATQMLESMITNARPTRAEVSDVANAVMDGTDAVMLSGETAAGADPVTAVTAMARICMQAELAMIETGGGYAAHAREAAASGIHDALALGAERMARAIGAGVIVCATVGLKTARYLASARPSQQIVGMTPDCRSLGRLCLLWGVEPVWCPQFEDTSDALKHAKMLVAERGMVEPGGFMVLAVGRGPSREFSARLHLYQMPSEVTGVHRRSDENLNVAQPAWETLHLKKSDGLIRRQE